MHLPSLTAKQWLDLKVLCGDIYILLKQDRPVPDSLHFSLLNSMQLPPATTTDYFLYGTTQFKAITSTLSLLYMDSEPADQRHVFIYQTPVTSRIWHRKS